MSLYYPTSTVYGIGQKFAFSQDQGSTYLGMAYTDRLSFTPTLSITEPRSPALLTPTIANYPIETKPFFMGSFDGFWIHKLYVGDILVGTVQTVNQDLFMPIHLNDRGGTENQEQTKPQHHTQGDLPCSVTPAP